MKILIIGPTWVGDMVMAQSLFRAIKLLHENVQLDVVAPEWSRPLLSRMPEVHNTFSLPIPHGKMAFNTRFNVAKKLRTEQYDQAIVLPNSWKSALIPWLAKIPKRTGWMGEMRWGLLNDIRKLDKKNIKRMVERFVMLAYPKNTLLSNIHPTLLPPKLISLAIDQNLALEKFSLSKENPILALCPGAEFGPSKRWPEEYYAEIAKEKIKEGWSVWLFGSKNDQTVSNKIQNLINNKAIDLTGRTNLGEAIDLLALSTAVVSNDSGLMHIAAALDKPLIALYGSTDPGFTPPLHNKALITKITLPCSPCFKRECPLKHQECMRKLTPNIVLKKLSELGTQCGY